MSGLALLFASHAWSTVPNCSVVALLTNFPQPGQFVPQNAQIRIQGLSTAVLPDGLEVLVDDVSVDYDRVNHNYDPAGLYTMTVLTPVEPFPAFADVRVAHISTGQTVLEFTVDEGLDTTPPEWDGSLAIREQYRSGKWIPCNDVYLHGFFLENVTDDLTEDLGFFVPGEGHIAAEEGLTPRHGPHPINTSGGLKSKGHSVGASATGQAVEIFKQMRGLAGKRQVERDIDITLTHNVGGTGQTAVVHIYARS